MKSAWWWGTDECERYEAAYWAGRNRPDTYKSSPLADDHVFDDPAYVQETHYSSVLDLTQPLEAIWTGIRKSYHQLIHRANEEFRIVECCHADMAAFQSLHTRANDGFQPRNDLTYGHQANWIMNGSGMLVMGTGVLDDEIVAAAYWKLYQGCAYFGSGPSIERGVQHAVIWHSLELLKARGIAKVEIGQVDGDTPKEKSIGFFKSGWSNTTVPFIMATRRK